MALTKLKYFHDPPRISIIGMIMGNPMIILMAFCGIISSSPRCFQHDPEAMKEFEKAQGEEDPMAAIKKMMGLRRRKGAEEQPDRKGSRTYCPI